MKSPHQSSFLTALGVLVAFALASPLRGDPRPAPMPLPAPGDAPVGAKEPTLMVDGKVNTMLVSQVQAWLASLEGADRVAYVESLYGLLSGLRDTLGNTNKDRRNKQAAIDVQEKLKKDEKDPANVAQIDQEIQKLKKDKEPIDAKVGVLEVIEFGLMRILEQEDTGNLQVDLHGAAVFSTLYRDAGETALFKNSKAFLELETRQSMRPATTRDWDIWGRISLQTAQVATATPTPVATAAPGRATAADAPPSTAPKTGDIRSFSVEFGTEHAFPDSLQLASGKIRLGALVGIAVYNYESTKGDANFREQDSDDYRIGARGGLILRQVKGNWAGSLTEVSYLHDPRFRAANRFFARGRLELSAVKGEGRGLGTFVEGSLNMGSGRDEARLIVGVHLNPLAILRGVVGGVTEPSPGSP